MITEIEAPKTTTISLTEAAKLLGISRQTVWVHINNGAISGEKDKGRNSPLRIKLASISDYLSKRSSLQAVIGNYLFASALREKQIIDDTQFIDICVSCVAAIRQARDIPTLKPIVDSMLLKSPQLVQLIDEIE
jgi:excisionase family DNA binding protein